MKHIVSALVFQFVIVVLGTTNHAEVVAGGSRVTFGVVLSNALQTKEVGLLVPGFRAVYCCAVVTDELQAEFIYEQACNLVFLVHGTHVPETRGKDRVPGGRTFMQNCVKRSWGLTYLV